MRWTEAAVVRRIFPALLEQMGQGSRGPWASSEQSAKRANPFGAKMMKLFVRAQDGGKTQMVELGPVLAEALSNAPNWTSVIVLTARLTISEGQFKQILPFVDRNVTPRR